MEKLTEARLTEIRAALAGRPGVAELFGHIAYLEDQVTVVNQYYEEFLIPEIQRGGWATREEQRRDPAARGRAGPRLFDPG